MSVSGTDESKGVSPPSLPAEALAKAGQFRSERSGGCGKPRSLVCPLHLSAGRPWPCLSFQKFLCRPERSEGPMSGSHQTKILRRCLRMTERFLKRGCDIARVTLVTMLMMPPHPFAGRVRWCPLRRRHEPCPAPFHTFGGRVAGCPSGRDYACPPPF